jgi:DHA3 family tetracycline resistance protein-like MFS transporter
VLLLILGIAAIHGMASEGYDRLWAAHLLANFSLPPLGPLEPVVWFGLISAGGRLLSIGVTEVIRRRVDTSSHQAVGRVLVVGTALLAASVATLGLVGGFALALALLWLITVLRQINEPLANAWLNQHLDSRMRATVISMSGQADAFGQIVFGPIIGAIGAVAGLRVALVTAGLALSPNLLLYARALRRPRGADETVAETA